MKLVTILDLPAIPDDIADHVFANFEGKRISLRKALSFFKSQDHGISVAKGIRGRYSKVHALIIALCLVLLAGCTSSEKRKESNVQLPGNSFYEQQQVMIHYYMPLVR